MCLHGKKANSILACVRYSLVSKSRVMIFPLFLALVRLTSSAQLSFGSLSSRKTLMPLACPENDKEAVKGLEHNSDEEQLREQGLLRLEKSCFSGEIIALYNSQNGGCSTVRVDLFSELSVTG